MNYGNRSGEMEVFVRVIEAGSFSAAARELGLTPSAVSKLIARMEVRLGIRLLTRTARTLAPTPEGEAYYQRSVRILADIDEADRAATEGVAPSGRLRVYASIPFGNNLLAPLLPRFLAQYPRIKLDLSFSDETANLVEERADIAIRMGPLPDSDLKARRLGTTRLYMVASPDYLAQYGTPDRPADLALHNCLNFNFQRTIGPWRFVEDRIDAPITGNAEANNGETLRQLVLAGLGMGRLAAFHVADDITSGRLLRVLAEHDLSHTEDIHVVYVDRRHMAGRIRAFIDFLIEEVGPVLRKAEQRCGI
ncbi:LysR family transcriptional regulator [Billgrantia saliphila]|uniref:LysR family transcriptional regulator n=1 Tax=Billgrantia saliphila TaxID=1848458 RepID=UPI000CE2C87D|nr:LysR family transcriptional regulator [Halomonas saliphila]